MFRYNARFFPEFFLNEFDNTRAVVNGRWLTQFFFMICNLKFCFAAVDAVNYSGSGTRTGQALSMTADVAFTVANGRRSETPAVVIVITDGEFKISKC